MDKAKTDLLKEKKAILEFYLEHKDVIRMLVEEFCEEQLRVIECCKTKEKAISVEVNIPSETKNIDGEKLSIGKIDTIVSDETRVFKDVITTEEDLAVLDAWIIKNKYAFKKRKQVPNGKSYAKDYEFTDFFARLYRYYEQNGTMQISYNYVEPDGYELGGKVYQIRKNIRTGQDGIKLNDFQKMVLQRVGFAFDNREGKVEEIYSRTLKYKEKYRDVRIKSTYVDEDGYLLGKKLMQMRNGIFEITDEQKERFTALGFDWAPGKSGCFNSIESKYYKALETYKQEKGDVFVPFEYVDSQNFALGLETLRILQNQVYRNVGYKLNRQQTQKLDELGFCWELSAWQDKLNNAQDLSTIKTMVADKNPSTNERTR